MPERSGSPRTNSPVQELREIYYSGRVQGVGFRFTTLSIARRYPVTGYVENLADERVHLEVEGNVADVERFLSELERAMARHITNVQVDRRAAQGHWSEFAIRY